MTEQIFEPMRRSMVASQLRTTGVNDPRVVAAMGIVARERFVPEDRRVTAYSDGIISLGRGRALNPPMVLGRLLTEARPGGGEHALVVWGGDRLFGGGAGQPGRFRCRARGGRRACRWRGRRSTIRTWNVEGPLAAGHAGGVLTISC